MRTITVWKRKGRILQGQYSEEPGMLSGEMIHFGSGSSHIFFSKAMYDELIHPYEVMLRRTAVDCGLIVEHHVCGMAESLIPDIIETGATIWQTAQVMNDLNKILPVRTLHSAEAGSWTNARITAHPY